MQQAAARGLSFGASTPGETELAELVKQRVQVDGDGPIEKLRMVSTGTEATMTAIRLARGYTGRDLLVKFAGHYHGHSDSLLAEAGSGVATLALPAARASPPRPPRRPWCCRTTTSTPSAPRSTSTPSASPP